MIRRTFIENAGKATLLGPLGLTKLDGNDNEVDQDRRIGLAVIGLGNFARYAAPRINAGKQSKIVALVSNDSAKAKEWAAQYGIEPNNIYNYDNLDNIINNEEVDAVYITTPVGTHADFAIRALKAGKHVLTEKTMAATVGQAEQMIEAAKLANKKLMVAYRARYEPYNQQAIKFSQEGTYGRITSIAAHKGFYIGDKLGKNDWRIKKDMAGGGALVDIGIYSIQACRYIAGKEPVEVCGFSQSTGRDPRFQEVEENLSFMMRFDDGILATGSASWNYALQNYYRVGTTDGYIELEPATSNGRLRMIVKETEPTFIGERYFADIDQITAEVDHFSECIINDTQPLTNGDEGLKDLKVIEAIYRSIEERRPIQL